MTGGGLATSGVAKPNILGWTGNYLRVGGRNPPEIFVDHALQKLRECKQRPFYKNDLQTNAKNDTPWRRHCWQLFLTLLSSYLKKNLPITNPLRPCYSWQPLNWGSKGDYAWIQLDRCQPTSILHCICNEMLRLESRDGESGIDAGTKISNSR